MSGRFRLAPRNKHTRALFGVFAAGALGAAAVMLSTALELWRGGFWTATGAAVLFVLGIALLLFGLCASAGALGFG